MAVVDGIRRRVLDGRVVIAIARRVLPGLDRRLLRVSGGRFSLAPKGARVLLLTTTGRRTGRPRTTPVMYTADGDGYLVVASNWGEPGDPAWLANLRADPAASIEVGGRRRTVTARLVMGEERVQLWAHLIDAWPLYADLATRAGGRKLAVVRLLPLR
jgi:deazaflavin-dependent oxidoreductase (nitroreductase family)